MNAKAIDTQVRNELPVTFYFCAEIFFFLADGSEWRCFAPLEGVVAFAAGVLRTAGGASFFIEEPFEAPD